MRCTRCSNAYVFVPEFDEPRVPGHGRPDLYVGPTRRLGAPLLEVMAERIPPRDVEVFHVMQARPKFLALLDDEGE
jgi:hypothetical protein